MGRKLKLRRDPYEKGEYLRKKGTFEIKPGVTVLVGCNGIGKTTLLKNLKDELKKENIPVIEYNNLLDGGSSGIESMLFHGDTSFAATAMCSSEGENILINLGQFFTKLRQFIRTGTDKDDVVRKLFPERFGEITTNERWILLDAVDSGLSIDNVVELKTLFDLIIKDAGEKEVYIIVSANGYEMANGEPCFDAYNMKYVKFKDYGEYRDFVLESQKWKKERDKK